MRRESSATSDASSEGEPGRSFSGASFRFVADLAHCPLISSLFFFASLPGSRAEVSSSAPCPPRSAAVWVVDVGIGAVLSPTAASARVVFSHDALLYGTLFTFHYLSILIPHAFLQKIFFLLMLSRSRTHAEIVLRVSASACLSSASGADLLLSRPLNFHPLRYFHLTSPTWRLPSHLHSPHPADLPASLPLIMSPLSPSPLNRPAAPYPSEQDHDCLPVNTPQPRPPHLPENPSDMAVLMHTLNFAANVSQHGGERGLGGGGTNRMSSSSPCLPFFSMSVSRCSSSRVLDDTETLVSTPQGPVMLAVHQPPVSPHPFELSQPGGRGREGRWWALTLLGWVRSCAYRIGVANFLTVSGTS